MSGGHRIGATTRVFALLGDPVAHSRSPLFQNAALRHLGLDGVYVALRCSADDVPALVRALARAGGGGNVTVPHKATVLPALERTTAAVDRTGACNTFWLEDGRVCGDNTDVAGFREALAGVAGNVRGARVLLLGAGGAASAAACALLEAGVERIDVLNRTPAAAETLRVRFDEPDRIRVADLPPMGHASFDLVVNATSLGMAATDPLPLDPAQLHRAGAALDVVYRPGGTRWVRAARAAGIPAADGLEMLLHQGAAAFRRWWSREPPIDAMRAALRGAADGSTS